jgi:hypothetical protein
MTTRLSGAAREAGSGWEKSGICERDIDRLSLVGVPRGRIRRSKPSDSTSWRPARGARSNRRHAPALTRLNDEHADSPGARGALSWQATTISSERRCGVRADLPGLCRIVSSDPDALLPLEADWASTSGGVRSRRPLLEHLRLFLLQKRRRPALLSGGLPAGFGSSSARSYYTKLVQEDPTLLRKPRPAASGTGESGARETVRTRRADVAQDQVSARRAS